MFLLETVREFIYVMPVQAGLCKFSLAGPVKQNVFLMKLDDQAYQHLMLRHPKQRTLYINILTVAPLDEG